VPRYFFYTNNPDAPGSPEGWDFKSVAIAKCEAVRFAGQLLCDSAESFWDGADFEMTVTDEKGLILFTMRLVGTEAPAIRKDARPSSALRPS
jgi:carbohydrate-selective porin OprB